MCCFSFAARAEGGSWPAEKQVESSLGFASGRAHPTCLPVTLWRYMHLISSSNHCRFAIMTRWYGHCGAFRPPPVPNFLSIQLVVDAEFIRGFMGWMLIGPIACRTQGCDRQMPARESLDRRQPLQNMQVEHMAEHVTEVIDWSRSR